MARPKLNTTRRVVKRTSKKNPSVIKGKQTRNEILQTIANVTGLPKVQIESVFSTTNELIHAHMKKRGSGEFIIPMTGVKIRRIRKKATKARQMFSPLTNASVTVAAKPARSAIKLSALKPLKLALDET